MPPSIDRKAIVDRHCVQISHFDTSSPLSVGNGQFTFTVDATGLQTFPQVFEKTIPLGTLSHWAWHIDPNPHGYDIDRFHWQEFDVDGRKVPYADVLPGPMSREIHWLRSNPHRLHLGYIGLHLLRSDGSPVRPEDLEHIQQTLDLWQGTIHSRFRFQGHQVSVQTVCHPYLDAVATRIESDLIRQARLGLQIAFPYANAQMPTADWSRPDEHWTELLPIGPNRVRIHRKLSGQGGYQVRLCYSPRADLKPLAPHRFVIQPPAGTSNVLEVTCWFLPDKTSCFAELVSIAQPSGTEEPPDFSTTLEVAAQYWKAFWGRGGAVDLSESADRRWYELERRIVLSQYLTAIQCAGGYPPAETGLTYNSWFGKFHLEMHWWHAVHFALWDRIELLERSLDYYQSILPRARSTAARQGYQGARWPKMTDPSGKESPSPIGPFLIWQQPHPIYYAELCYRARPGRQTLLRFQEIVWESAGFMASYALWRAPKQQYVLGPVLQCAQERFPKACTLNPTFELTYWRWGLETAQKWRQRLGLNRDPQWDHVLHHLARPLIVDGKYAFAQTAPDSYTNPRWNDDHPAVLGALGMLPGDGIDPAVMRRTFDWIWENWNWNTTWGWDCPLLAMSAARLGDPHRAVEALLKETPKNTYQKNGHNYQRPDLTVYLPANGGLLTAVAMMAAGWDNGPDRPAPGFPDNGSWRVRWDGLKKMI